MKEQAAKAKAKGRSSAPLDETAADESKAWQAKMGKWSKGAVEAISCEAFLVTLSIAHVVLSKIDLLQWTIMKVRPEVGNLAYLLYTGGQRALDALEDLLRGEAQWADVYSLVERTCPDKLGLVIDGSKRLVLRAVASYQRRIMSRLLDMCVFSCCGLQLRRHTLPQMNASGLQCGSWTQRTNVCPTLLGRSKRFSTKTSFIAAMQRGALQCNCMHFSRWCQKSGKQTRRRWKDSFH